MESFLQKNNQSTFEEASRRTLLKEKWDDALRQGNILTEEMSIPYVGEGNYNEKVKTFRTKSLKYLINFVLSVDIKLTRFSLPNTPLILALIIDDNLDCATLSFPTEI